MNSARCTANPFKTSVEKVLQFLSKSKMIEKNLENLKVLVIHQNKHAHGQEHRDFRDHGC